MGWPRSRRFAVHYDSDNSRCPFDSACSLRGHAGSHRPYPRARAALRRGELSERHHPHERRRRRETAARSFRRSMRLSSIAPSRRSAKAIVTEYAWDAGSCESMPHSGAHDERSGDARGRRDLARGGDHAEREAEGERRSAVAVADAAARDGAAANGLGRQRVRADAAPRAVRKRVAG